VSELADMTGKTVLVTGATSGIGRDAATRLADAGARVLVHGRDADAGREVVDGIEDSGGTASFHQADFDDLAAVRRLGREVKGETEGLDVLCNNAGLFVSGSEESEQGYELTFAVNHLAPYLLTHRLASHLNDGARVVVTSSEAHRSGSIDLEAVESEGSSGSTGFAAYADSKFANVLFTRELAHRFERGTANCLHPGVIPGSGFARGIPFPASLGWKLMRYVPGVGDTVADGGRALSHLAASHKVEGVTGRYFDGTDERAPATKATDDDLAARLWDLSAALVKTSPELPAPSTSEA
jgi:hypothetical protein